MTKMAQAFNTTVAALEDELTQLILEGLINARIDSHSKVSDAQVFFFYIFHIVLILLSDRTVDFLSVRCLILQVDTFTAFA